MPNEQHNDGAEGCCDQACALVQSVPADGLTDICRYEGSGDAECRGQKKAYRVVGSGREPTRDQAGDEAMMTQRMPIDDLLS
jgi:hypothetical protein